MSNRSSATFVKLSELTRQNNLRRTREVHVKHNEAETQNFITHLSSSQKWAFYLTRSKDFHEKNKQNQTNKKLTPLKAPTVSLHSNHSIHDFRVEPNC